MIPRKNKSKKRRMWNDLYIEERRGGEIRFRILLASLLHSFSICSKFFSVMDCISYRDYDRVSVLVDFEKNQKDFGWVEYRLIYIKRSSQLFIREI